MTWGGLQGGGGGALTDAALAAKYVVQQNQTTGAFEVGGVEIPPAIPLTFAAMQALDHTQYGTLFFLCTDKHSVGSTGGSLWQNDATGDRPILRSDPIRVADMSTAITTYAAATYPGLKLHVIDWDIDIVSNGTRWKPLNNSARILTKIFGTIASPTAAIAAGTINYNFNTLLGSPTLPAGMLSIGDELEFRATGLRNGATATMTFKVSLGTAGTNSDAFVWTGTLAATDALTVNTMSKVTVGDATNFTTNGSSSFSGAGGAGILLNGTTNFSILSALIISVNGTKNTADTINLLSLSVTWTTP